MANAAAPTPQANMGEPAVRLDARLKVTGEARYPSDMPVGNPAYAYLVTSPIARGRIERLALDASFAVPGVLTSSRRTIRANSKTSRSRQAAAAFRLRSNSSVPRSFTQVRSSLS